jgi:hypothetical protein
MYEKEKTRGTFIRKVRSQCSSSPILFASLPARPLWWANYNVTLESIVVTIYLSIYISVCLSMALQPFVGPWPLFSFLIFLHGR